jgi:hypothetical protein
MVQVKDLQEDLVEEMQALAPGKDIPVNPAVGVAAMALNMALKYHNMCVVKDGTLYQQYKLEGKNIHTIGLDDIFETAMQMEVFLLGASTRIANLVIDAIKFEVEEDPKPKGDGNVDQAP